MTWISRYTLEGFNHLSKHHLIWLCALLSFLFLSVLDISFLLVSGCLCIGSCLIRINRTLAVMFAQFLVLLYLFLTSASLLPYNGYLSRSCSVTNLIKDQDGSKCSFIPCVEIGLFVFRLVIVTFSAFVALLYIFLYKHLNCWFLDNTK